MRKWLKKAPAGAFFVLAALLSPLLPAAAAPHCGPPADARTVQVRYVHDGDTLVLADNRKIRLIGINTPEVARDQRPAEALAIRARDRLRQYLFASGNRARLRLGEQPRDRYGRHLAYLWDAEGHNLVARLLREGLGWQVAIPPNLDYLDCYREARDDARRAGRGVWGHPAWKARAAAGLSLRDTGFQRVSGRVTAVSHGGRATWIRLGERLTLKLPDADRQRFPQPPGPEWVGRRLEVRGWVYRVRGKLRLNIHHPVILDLSEAPAGR